MRSQLSALILLLAVLSLLVWTSCGHEEVPRAEGSIALTFSTAEPTTRAASGDPSDGGGIAVDANGDPDIVILIADRNGDFVAWYPDDFRGAMATGYTSDCITSHTASTPATQSTIYFTGPPRGTYSVFAIANTAGLSAAMRTSIAGAADMSALEALYLEVAGEPSFDPMPLSATGSLSVNSSGNGQVNLDLLRMVSRVSLTFVNQTGDADIDIHACEVTIHAMNPYRGYIFPKATDYYSGYDHNLVITGADPLVFINNKSTLPVKQVLPSVAPAQLVGSRYLCDITFRITKDEQVYLAGNDATYTEYTFPNLPVHDSRSTDIPYLKRNQHLKIETRITKRANEHDVSFNFEVASWTEREASVVFN